MTIPANLVPLVDGDILRYEIGYAAEVGWKAITEDPEALPPFDYVKDMLHDRLASIGANCNTDIQPILYITKGRTFRFDLAKRREYKGRRVEKRPWHFNNLSVYVDNILGAKVITNIEADDALSIDHVTSGGTTILCSRDKDLRQVPGWFYSWELGKQASFGPELISKDGYLKLSDNHKKLTGTGLAFFYAQVLMGDVTDNIPGLPNWGPVITYATLDDPSTSYLETIIRAYQNEYGQEWEEELLEQGRLCWMTRKLHEDGSPVLWEIGMTE